VFEGEGRSSTVALSAAACLAPWPERLWCRLRCRLLPLGRSVAARPPHGRRSRHARASHTHGFSCGTSRTGRSYKTSYAVRVGATFLDGLVLTPVVRTGARTSSRAPGRPPFAGMALVRPRARQVAHQPGASPVAPQLRAEALRMQPRLRARRLGSTVGNAVRAARPRRAIPHGSRRRDRRTLPYTRPNVLMAFRRRRTLAAKSRTHAVLDVTK